MTTCEQIKAAAKIVYPSSLHVGCLDLSPPVRLVQKVDEANFAAWLLDPDMSLVWLVGCDGSFPIDEFEVSKIQGRILPEGITEDMLDVMEDFLNAVANERENDGQGSSPTSNARKARDLMDVWFMTRKKPVGLI